MRKGQNHYFKWLNIILAIQYDYLFENTLSYKICDFSYLEDDWEQSKWL